MRSAGLPATEAAICGTWGIACAAGAATSSARAAMKAMRRISPAIGREARELRSDFHCRADRHADRPRQVLDQVLRRLDAAAQADQVRRHGGRPGPRGLWGGGF